MSGTVSAGEHDGFFRKSDLQAKCSYEQIINVDHAESHSGLIG